MLRSFALLALLALCFVALADASPLSLQRRRPHITAAHAPAAATPATPAQSSSDSPQLVHRAVGSAARRQQMRQDQWSYTMAYHVEPQRPPKPLYEAQYDIEDYHTVMPGATSSGYDIEMDDVIQNAMYYAAASTPNNNTAWVFDVDETSLSGYTEMLSIGFGYVAKINHDWVLSAVAPAITQTLNLYKQLITQGYKVIFLTGRKDTEHDATATNLVNVGYTQFETLITRTPAQYNLTAQAYKSGVRTMLVEQEGYDIVGCIGDQFSDINGPYTGFKVKLPNYIYYLV